MAKRDYYEILGVGRDASEADVFGEEWQRWFGDDVPLGQETVMPAAHRRAGFRVSIGAIAAQ